MSYQDTSLWKRTLGKDDPNVEPLKNSFLRAREHAEFLLGKIRKDFPNLTVHDITHVDSLWNVADTIIGKNYPINPLEGYILGISFLIHDAALSYDTVGGVDKLRDTIQWKDAYADGPGEKDEEEFKKECDFDAIRALHAKYAEDIPTQTYKKDNGTTFYIIENDDYRTYFGELIGTIAASHHWTIDDIESRLDPQVNPIAEVPGDWEINAQKLACILRCADAGHIDNGRAPYNIYRSLNVNGVSRNHWESQIRLGQVRPNKKDSGKLLITSTKAFKKDDFAAWNVAYEAVILFDEELKKCNNLLKSIDEDLVFPYNGVSGADSKEELANYIKTEDWQPCNFGVHTSNIKYLIENLGGSKLYGEDSWLLIALRELIQNARDAIHARLNMDDSFHDGRITMRLIEENNSRFLEVEDNGIGMSMDCIKNHLLDFGSSYWKSSLSKYENPGLRSSEFRSIGKFGIGFYSIFMVAKSVEVRTKRFGTDSRDAKKLEFPTGLTLSPILSKDTMSASVSTIVKLELKDDVELSLKIFRYSGKDLSNLQKVLPILVAVLDADVYWEYSGKLKKIHTNINSQDFDKARWLGDLFIPCPVNIKYIASMMEEIEDENHKKRGLILPPEYKKTIKFPLTSDKGRIPSIQTIGGLLSSLELFNHFDGRFIGYLDGTASNISRNQMILDPPLMECLKEWTKRKYLKNHSKMISDQILAKSYIDLIGFCSLQDEIVNENIRRIYETRGSIIKLDRFVSLRDIHRFLFIGTTHYAGDTDTQRRADGYRRIAVIDSQSKMQEKMDYPEYDNDKANKYKNSIIRYLYLKLAALNYEDVILKYCKCMSIHPFVDGNKRALGVWANLALDRLEGKMINWENIPRHIFNELYESYYDKDNQAQLYEKISRSFKKHSCKTEKYLHEIYKIKT